MNFEALDLNLLRVFEAVYDEQNVTKAGERLSLSQPATSAGLNRLRHAVGDPLFIRQGNRMVPTPKAHTLYGGVHGMLSSVEQSLMEVSSFEPLHAKRSFRFFGADYFSELLMPPLSANCAKYAPNIRLQLIDNGRGDMVGQLTKKEVHLAIEREMIVPDWISSKTVMHSSFLIAIAKDHPAQEANALLSEEDFPLDLFCSLPHVLCSPSGETTGLVDEALAKIGRERQVNLTLPQFHSVAVAVSEGPFIAALPTAIARKYASMLGLCLFNPPVSVSTVCLKMYWHKRHDHDDAYIWLQGEVEKALAPYVTE